MKTSPAGIAALEAREGKRFVAYQDSNGVWTIGVGHTGRMAPPTVYKGMTITPVECDAFLAADLAPVEKAINGLGATLTQNQFDACASLGFNIGVAGFQRSSVASWIHKGDMPAAAAAFMLWDKPAVLKARREAERAQFLTPDKQPAPVSAAASAPAKPPGVIASSSGQVPENSEISPPMHTKSSSGVITHSPPVPVGAKPATAPVAAAPAHPSATTKETTMTASINPTVTPAATANPVANFLSGILGGIKTKLEDTAAALENGTASAASATTAATNAVSSAPDAIAAAEDIAKLVVEVETHDWTDIPGTFMDFVNRAIAILGKFKIVLPELTVAQSILSKFTGPAPAKA